MKVFAKTPYIEVKLYYSLGFDSILQKHLLLRKEEYRCFGPIFEEVAARLSDYLTDIKWLPGSTDVGFPHILIKRGNYLTLTAEQKFFQPEGKQDIMYDKTCAVEVAKALLAFVEEVTNRHIQRPEQDFYRLSHQVHDEAKQAEDILNPWQK